MGCMETDHDEPLFTNHFKLLLGLILPKAFLDKENCFRKQVLWSDERKIELFGHNNIQKIWRKNGEAFLPKNTVPTFKDGGSSMMFWDSG